MPDIFISHATANDDLVTQIHDELERDTGREMWVDHKDINPGDNWQDSIELALKECPDMLLVVSRQSMSSVEVMAEWRAALTYKHRLLLAIIDDIPIADIPARLRLLQWVDLHKDYAAGMQKLVAAIKGKAIAGDEVIEFKSALPITGTIDRRLTQTPLRGRDKDVTALKAAISTAPTVIVGVGGLGKSKLAAEVALTGDAWQGVIWQRMNEFTQVYDVIDLLKQHFELPPATERRDVLAKLKTRKTLVVLDNAEDVPPDDPRHPDFVRLVNDLLAHNAQVLITSRLEWKALKPVKVVEPAQLDPASARQLVLDLGEREGIDDLAKEADEIASAALYHPRLIEWAVELLTTLPRREVLDDLRTRQSEDAQEAMQAMVGKTLDRLIASGAKGEQAAGALKRLVVCRGGLTLDAARAIIPPLLEADAVRTALTTLTTWRLVRFEPKTERYDLPPIVIAALPPDTSAHRLHCEYYEALARQHEESADHEKYLKLDVESDNLEAAFEWAMDAAGYEQAYWLYNACEFFLANRGRFEQSKTWLERVAAAISVEEGVISRLQAAVQNSLGLLYWQYPLGDRQANLKQSITAYEAALVYFTPQIEPQEYAATQNNLGIAYANLASNIDPADNLTRAVAAYEAALIYLTPQSAPLDYAITQNNLGEAYRNLSDITDRAVNLKRAVAAYEAALAYLTPQSVPLQYAGTQNNLGNTYQNLSEINDRTVNLKRAVVAYETALIYRTPQSAPLDYAMTQANLGWVHKSQNDLVAAIACWREAERYFLQMGTMEYAERVQGWIAEAE